VGGYAVLKEFQSFIKKGNVLDLAVAVIIGGAFGAIVSSLVTDIIMPLIGIVLGGIDFTGLSFTIGAAELTYGNFIQAIINFLVITFVIFIMIRQVKKMEKPAEKAPPAAPPQPSPEEKLLTEIRDILKAKQ
jgi:large conductance mechanosensitive channel